ncbi:MAG: hypothetical protein U0T83_04005 [Bacteriovoracaceae bacterium]
MLTLIKLFLEGKSTRRFMLGAIFSFSFSITVILSTIGIMDGFIFTLKHGLKNTSGDITLFNREKPFNFNDRIKAFLHDNEITDYSPIVKTEAFLIYNDNSKGIEIKGIDNRSFSDITGVGIPVEPENIVIGSELASQLKIKKGDFVTIAFSTGNEGVSGLPLLKRIRVNHILHHGIYARDLRNTYMLINDLQKNLRWDDTINGVTFNLPKGGNIQKFIDLKKHDLDSSFYFRPYWSEFATLLEAVEVEKLSISLILQVIVIVSIFNVIAIVFFLNERKSQEIFLFQALGLSKKSLLTIWAKILTIMWILSCVFSILLIQFVDFALRNWSVLQIPGEIYTLTGVSIRLSMIDYLIVFAIALIWLILIFLFNLKKFQKNSLLYGLRKEFV